LDAAEEWEVKEVEEVNEVKDWKVRGHRAEYKVGSVCPVGFVSCYLISVICDGSAG
jgi:hypothetical protein